MVTFKNYWNFKVGMLLYFSCKVSLTFQTVVQLQNVPSAICLHRPQSDPFPTYLFCYVLQFHCIYLNVLPHSLLSVDEVSPMVPKHCLLAICQLYLVNYLVKGILVLHCEVQD